MNIFELGTERAEDGAVMELIHPKTMEVIEGSTITLLGSDSAKAVKIQRNREKSAINRAFKGGKKAVVPTPEELYEQATEDLVALTVAWTLSDASGPMECTPENAKRLYTDPIMQWVREQALEFIRDRSNFFGA